ncbi:MAG: AEC family transporter [Ruminococcaceae bacterium]|nr:AEC family transporter [Oscillospiraceae bacterium]
MLDNLAYSVNAILPIFLLVLIGAFLKKFNKLNDSFVDVADWLVFKIGLPVMLFSEVAGSSISENLDLKLIVFLVVSVTTSFFCVSLISIISIRDRSKRGAFIQGICRSNFAILGVPLAVNMFGEAGGSAIAIAMPFVILMFNSYSVVILSIFSGSDKHKLDKKAVLGILKNIITNPLIIGVLLGIPFMVTGASLPIAVDKTLSYLSGLTTPLALMSLGANFRIESLRGRIGYAITAAIGKTVVIPALALTAAILVGIRGPELGVVMICFGAPTAVSSYIMAKKMDNDHELAAQILLLSTFLCVFTIFIMIFILKTFAFI